MKNVEFINICYSFLNEDIALDELYKMLEKINKKNLSDVDISEIENLMNMIKEEEATDKHPYAKAYEIENYISSNEYIKDCIKNLTDDELFKVVAKYIRASFAPDLDQERFERLVKVGIADDARELLWRLSFTYEDSGLNFDSIVDYYIKVHDGYYLAELISAIGENLDIDSILDKVNDKEIIHYFLDNKGAIDYFVTEEQFDKLKDKLS